LDARDPPWVCRRGGAPEARGGARASRSDLLSTAAGGHVEDEDRRFIGELVRRLDAIEAAWDAVADTSGGLPSTLVHADFVGKNLRIKHGVDGTPSIVAFDWEMSGWGVPLRDLALVDIGAYAFAARSVWGERSGDLGRLAEIGRVCSLLASIEWEMPGLRTDWPSRYLA